MLHLSTTPLHELYVAADTPAEDFWSVIVYSMETKGFIQGAERVGLASTKLESMNVNDDGSVDIYFAPEAPEDQKSNWIPTGEDWFIGRRRRSHPRGRTRAGESHSPTQ